MVTGNSKVLGVVGFPVEHSLSPAMHNAAISELGLPYVYVPFSVRPELVGEALQSMVTLGIVGLNFTIPHKTVILPFLDEISDEARAVGAVNTVCNLNGRLHGFNTDGVGFISPLRQFGLDLSSANAVVIGAGGAARSAVYQLLSAGCTVTIANRSIEKARQLVCDLAGDSASTSASCIELGDLNALQERVAQADIVVNSTSVGMSGLEVDATPIRSEFLNRNLIVYDMIYVPQETRLLCEARNVGARTINGVDMLVGQGAASFELWTGVKPSLQAMKNSVLASLSQA